MRNLKYYIKERTNPQLPLPCYYAYGQLSVKEAKMKEKTLYGINVMFSYVSEQEYRDKISELKINGFVVRER